MQPNNQSLKRFIAYILIVGLGIYLIFFAISYLRDGKLKVTSAPGSSISVMSLANPKPDKIGSGSASARLKPGQYIVQSTKNSSVSRSSVTISRRHTISISLNLTQAKSSTTVAGDVVAKKIRVNPDGSLIFLASSFRQLFSYSPRDARNIPYLPNIYPVTQADWLSNGGLVISNGTNYTSFVELSGQVDNTGDNLAQKGSNYSVAAAGQIAYLDSNSLMYKQSPLDQAVKLPVSIKNGSYNLQISPDGKKVLVYSDFRGADSKADSVFTNYLIDTATTANTETFNTDNLIDSAVWSADGKKLTYSLGTHLIEYDTTSKARNDILTSVASSPVWLLGYDNSDNLLYAQDSVIWQLNSAQLTSSKLTAYAGSIEVGSFNLVGNTLYYSTSADKSGAGGNIYKVNL
jgi:dipeptidyl aminopeptidase/acylaminoacyl peptidase